jgi:nicotinamide-nucleotide amidase
MIQDTNSAFISREINSERWHISAMLAVGDDEQGIKEGLEYLLGISDAVIVTGGLGPTADDKTTASIARAFGLGLYTDDAVLGCIKERFEKFRIAWSENNATQAVFPDGADPIYNPVGTAWGYSLKVRGTIIAVIPGVPAEVKRMLPEGVLPLLRQESTESLPYICKRTLKLFGITEAKVDEALAGDEFRPPGVSIGFYPRFPENHVVITSAGENEEDAHAQRAVVEEKIRAKLGKYIFGSDDNTLEGMVASLLTEKELTLAVAESCTGGLITDRLTNVPGSSVFFDRGVVSYSNISKIEMLGVPAATLETFGAVSDKTAVLMAEGVRKLGKTDVGLATTGIAGPAGGSKEKPVGTVYIALADGSDTVCRKFSFRWERRRIKEISSQWALEILRRHLVEKM